MNDQPAKRYASVVVVSAAAAMAAAAALDPQRFVAGWPIEPPVAAEVFDVPLDAEVYAHAASAEQLAILDVNGEPLSFFERSAPPAAANETRVLLEASPLYAENAAGAAVGVTTGERGTAVTVTQQAGNAPAVVGFVLDARSVQTPPLALELDWRALPQPFLVDVRIEQSSNLTDWRAVGGGSVAALLLGGAEVRHARVPVRADVGGYFRVRASRTVADWYLLRATLVSAARAAETPLTARIAPLAQGEAATSGDDEALYFDAGATLPVAAIALEFGTAGGWARVGVAASDSLAGPWSTVAYGELFYAIDFEGERLASPAHAVGRRAARYWRVLPAAPLRGQRLELRLEYPQTFLRVAAGGVPPYLLAAGTLAEEAGPDPTFLSVWTELGRADAVVPRARLGPRRELGGAAALVVPWRFPWRTAALWAVLCGGVLVVGWMAVRLAREMPTKPT